MNGFENITLASGLCSYCSELTIRHNLLAHSLDAKTERESVVTVVQMSRYTNEKQ